MNMRDLLEVMSIPPSFSAAFLDMFEFESTKWFSFFFGLSDEEGKSVFPLDVYLGAQYTGYADIDIQVGHRTMPVRAIYGRDMDSQEVVMDLLIRASLWTRRQLLLANFDEGDVARVLGSAHPNATILSRTQNTRIYPVVIAPKTLMRGYEEGRHHFFRVLRDGKEYWSMRGDPDDAYVIGEEDVRDRFVVGGVFNTSVISALRFFSGMQMPIVEMWRTMEKCSYSELEVMFHMESERYVESTMVMSTEMAAIDYYFDDEG